MVASLSSLSTSPCHLPLLPGSLLPSHPLWKCAELPASYAFPYFVTFVSVLPSAWNASSIFQPPLMTDSCIPPPRPLLFSTRIVGKVIYLKKKKKLILHGISSMTIFSKTFLGMQQSLLIFTSMRFPTHCVKMMY